MIDREVAEVAASAGDPSKAPQWYANIRSVDWVTPPPQAVGSRVAFVAGSSADASRMYEVTENAPGERLVMQTDGRPFPMRTAYTWEAVGPMRTRMTLSNSGRPSGFVAMGSAVLARAIRTATTKDLARLKALMESDGQGLLR